MRFQNQNRRTPLFNKPFLSFEWIKENWNAFVKKEKNLKKKYWHTYIVYIEANFILCISSLKLNVLQAWRKKEEK